MDNRDKQLQQHMGKRLQLAGTLPLCRQKCWAEKCVALAARQHRTAFYMMARMWLADISIT